MHFSKVFCVAALVSLSICVFAADVTLVLEPNKPAATLSFPYMGEVTGADVYVRSGPGTNYYRCGKLNAAEKVEVVGSENSWSKIVPPAGSFSWISKQYVSLDANNPGQGRVNGDDVRVRAGSEFVEPIHSTSLQAKLNKGAKVQLLGEEKDDYYKIAPPEGAYLWVSSEYLSNVGPAGKAGIGGIIATDSNALDPNAVRQKISVEAEKLKEYRQLARQVGIEHAKPVTEQSWSEIKTKLAEIADNNDAGKAARYAKLQLENVKGFELAREAGQDIQQQQSQLTQTREQIEKARQEQLAKLGDTGKFAIVGKIRPSLLYAKSSKEYRYLILGENNKVIAYALPAQSAANMDLSQFFGKKVGLVGTIERDPQTSSTLIRFTEVVEMK
ncbi:MAG: SH3 domain-containing protein [Sedimentisphaerales bacterium]|nr:SH3 domain-containing protein [Sedimentisphaerales bacterium]